MSKMRKSLPAYLPVNGVNYDAESLAVGEGDCLDIKNFRIQKHQLVTRPGLSQVGTSSTAEQTEVLSSAAAFALGSSTQGLDSTPHADVPVVLTITDSSGIEWVLTERLSDGIMLDVQGTECAQVIRGTPSVSFAAKPWPKLWGGTQYSPFSPGGNTTFVYSYSTTSDYPYPLPNGEIVLHMAIYRDPDEGEILFAFTDRGIYKYDDASGDATASFNVALSDADIGSFSGLTFWSTTEFTDENLGATMVAAGGVPPSAAGLDEDDGTRRVLFRWDRTAEEFVALDPRYESTETLYTWLGTEAASLPLAMGSAALPPVDYASVSIWWYEGSYVWTLTVDVSGNLKDPDGNTCGSFNLDTGAVSMTAMPADASATTSPYAPSAAVVVTLEYESEVYIRPRFVFNMNNRLIYVNTFDRDWDGVSDWEATGTYRPWRVMWGELNDITKIDIVTDWKDNVGVDTSPYVGGEYIGDMLILYRQSSIEQMYFVGSTSVFGFRTSVNQGLFAGNTVGLFRDLHFFMGKDNAYVYDGNTAQAIGNDRIREHLLSVAKTDTLDKFSSFVDGANAEYWLLISTVSDTYPTKAYVYSIIRDSWTVYEFPWPISAMQFRSEHFEKPLVGTSDGYVLKLDADNHNDSHEEWDGDSWEVETTAIDSFLETRDFVFGPLENLDRVQRVMFEAASDGINTIAVDASVDYGASWLDSQNIDLDTAQDERFYWVDHTERAMRLKFTATVYVSLRYIQISGLGKEEK